MRALQILAREHAAIAAMTDRFEAELDRLVGTNEVDAEAVDRLLRFFEVQVDGHHQEKEERTFMPALIARAMGDDLGILRALLDDHQAQRKLLAHARNQVEGATYGEPNSLAVLARSGRAYVREQREHSQWEQTVIFPLAARILHPSDDREIVRAFRNLDELWGSLVWEEARSLAEWLDRRRSPVQA